MNANCKFNMSNYCRITKNVASVGNKKVVYESSMNVEEVMAPDKTAANAARMIEHPTLSILTCAKQQPVEKSLLRRDGI